MVGGVGVVGEAELTGGACRGGRTYMEGVRWDRRGLTEGWVCCCTEGLVDADSTHFAVVLVGWFGVGVVMDGEKEIPETSAHDRIFFVEEAGVVYLTGGSADWLGVGTKGYL